MVRSGARSWWLVSVAMVAGGAFAAGCGGAEATTTPDGAGGASGGAGGSGAKAGTGGGINLAGEAGGGGTAGSSGTLAGTLSELVIEPALDELVVEVGETKSVTFKLMGRVDGGALVDVTKRAVFYVPAGWLVGGFPLDGSPVFTTALPKDAEDPVQRGGTVTVEATIANPGGKTLKVTRTFKVRLVEQATATNGTPQATPALPATPKAAFDGATVSPSRAPKIVYPLSGTLIPPNIGSFEVQFEKGAAENTLFELTASSATSSLTFYVRCGADNTAFDTGACVVPLSGEVLKRLGESNAGGEPITLKVRASDEAGTIGESATQPLEIAEQRIDGALYYWTATNPPRVMRVNFGTEDVTPSVFMAPSDVPGSGGTCVGCHVLSPKGDRFVAAIGSSGSSYAVVVPDLAKPRTDAAYFALDGANTGAPAANRLLNASFSPDGTEFVASAPQNDPADDKLLHFHNAATGVRKSTLTLPHAPSHPSWAPDGASIAMTLITGTVGSIIEFDGGSVGIVRKDGAGWKPAETLVPAATGKNRFNPSFTPDSKWLLYSESTDTNAKRRDGYSDPSATTWAVSAAGGDPVALTRAQQTTSNDAGRGCNTGDAAYEGRMDTFTRVAPFAVKHRGKDLVWFTVSSQRRAGLRKCFPNGSAVGDPSTQQLLWMFALEPAALAKGTDGSYPGFFLPMQSLATSNHMAEWTKQAVSDKPAPPPPAPPPPPPPPVPPPPIVK